MNAVHDPTAYADILHALRHANDGYSLTIWNSSDHGEEGWKLWSTLDAKYAEKDPGFLMTIPMSDVLEELKRIKDSSND